MISRYPKVEGMLGSLIYMMIMLILILMVMLMMILMMMPAITEGVVSSRSRGRELAPVCRARQAHPKHTLHSKKHKYTDTQIHKHKYANTRQTGAPKTHSA